MHMMRVFSPEAEEGMETKVTNHVYIVLIKCVEVPVPRCLLMDLFREVLMKIIDLLTSV